LQIFEVPAGFCLTPCIVVDVTTAEGAACTADIGNVSATQTHLLGADPNGYMDTLNLNSAVTQTSLIGDAHIGGSTYDGIVFVTNGTIDMTFGSAATETAIFDVWANGFMCGGFTSN